jgi:type II restriction enzyme
VIIFKNRQLEIFKMKKNQTTRLTAQHIKNKGTIGIFGKSAKEHDAIVNDYSRLVFTTLVNQYPNLDFRFRNELEKKEINQKLKKVDARLGATIFVENAAIKPDGGLIEVKDSKNTWRVVLVCEAKAQGKDIENISNGVLVGKNSDQELMVAGNAIERSHKNINEMRNLMIDEKHFPYILFLQGSNFLTEPYTVKKPDGTLVTLKHDVGSLNRIDRLTSANYSLPINSNCCENIFININGQSVMLQAVSIYTNPTKWAIDEMLPIMLNVAKTSLRVIGLIN